ncbi:2-keto-4-pentenoate hydratase [Streptomyces sp. A1136]|uniref:2-keto-4-pentenoate hydratase n=1 Tax=Streptomyces sp. A1136 TaxID=2563102 RepID=UPI00109E380D|nr:fumarylacetoacetate hydrolase family protein [Streptomyces sp. A1136]THA44646.1 hydratase [Streptomyces sp. A1136]
MPTHERTAELRAGQRTGDEVLIQLAAELAVARRTHAPAELISPRYPHLSLADAYRIQQVGTVWRMAAGAKVGGHKVGLTSTAMQEQMGIHEPDSGVIFDDMIVAGGSTLRVSDYMNPRIETEIAFRLARDLQGPTDLNGVRQAVGEVLLAFEVLDTRFNSWDVTLVDSIADNAACAGVITGRPVRFDPALDLGGEQITVVANGGPVASGAGYDILGDPLKALVWLTHRLPVLGTTLRAGDIVLAGSVHASFPLTPGMDIRATSTHLPSVHLNVL